MNSPVPIDGYRFSDLKRAGIVSSRGDLHKKQKLFGFPLPVKLAERYAWYPGDEIRAWVAMRKALRDEAAAKNASARLASLDTS
jgi:predicted DNA-binding transcriptional regulator AlpA